MQQRERHILERPAESVLRYALLMHERTLTTEDPLVWGSVDNEGGAALTLPVSEPASSAARPPHPARTPADPPSGGWCDAPIGGEDRTMFGECYFLTCVEPATTEAIGTWDVIFGVERTIALALCRRHADALRDEVLLLEVA